MYKDSDRLATAQSLRRQEDIETKSEPRSGATIYLQTNIYRTFDSHSDTDDVRFHHL
jgi:hypothetical protein